MTREEWRPVAGYEGSYEVSDRGRVRSTDRVVTYIDGSERHHRGRILAGYVNPDGHHAVVLYNNAIRQHMEIRTLVAEAFTPVKDVVAWSKGDRTSIASIDDAVKLLSTAEQAIAWYRAQLAAMSLAHEQLKAQLAEKSTPRLTTVAA